MKLLLIIDLKDKYLEMIGEAFPDLTIIKSLEPVQQAREIIDADFLVAGSTPDLELIKREKS